MPISTDKKITSIKIALYIKWRPVITNSFYIATWSSMAASFTERNYL